MDEVAFYTSRKRADEVMLLLEFAEGSLNLLPHSEE